MRSQASIRNIAPSRGLTPLGGLCLYGDHTVPEGAKVMELKACENCMCTFTREKRPLEARKVKNYVDARYLHVDSFSVIYVDRGERYCKHCRKRLLLPENQEVYKEQLLPILQQAHRGSKLPKYDDSLLPKEQRHVYTQPLIVPSIKRPKRPRFDYGKDWPQRLRAAFVERGPMSTEDIQEIVGGIGMPCSVLNIIRHAGIRLARIGSVPRRVNTGRAPGLYTMAELLESHTKMYTETQA